MNERIREVAKEAGFELNPAHFDHEKFAELIIQECRYLMDCNKGSDQNPAWNQALSETSEKIKEHFGVE